MYDMSVWTVVHQALGEYRSQTVADLRDQWPAETVWQAPLSFFKEHYPDIPVQIWEKYFTIRQKADLSLRAQWLQERDIHLIFRGDAEYPVALEGLYDPPALLYCRGRLAPEKLHLAMVGSRKATYYGKEVAERLAAELSTENCVVVSGLARGIDAKAHEGALEGGGGTIGVLGTGIDRVYPRENLPLYKRVAAHKTGAIISSFPLGAEPKPHHFPRRNRIIAGLCEGLVVVEAAAKSGALITANLALDNGRDVFAVPGMITSPQSEGCLRLIKDGAKMVCDANDILEEYGQRSLFDEEDKAKAPAMNHPQAAPIMGALSAVPVSLEYLLEELEMPVEELTATLSLLMIEGLVDELPGRQYKKRSV